MDSQHNVRAAGLPACLWNVRELFPDTNTVTITDSRRFLRGGVSIIERRPRCAMSVQSTQLDYDYCTVLISSQKGMVMELR